VVAAGFLVTAALVAALGLVAPVVDFLVTGLVFCQWKNTRGTT
jgi:hypothetical protein